jgi:uncharacterized protein
MTHATEAQRATEKDRGAESPALSVAPGLTGIMRRWLVIAGLLLVTASVAASQSAAERQRVAAWRHARLAELTADDGWLTLVGLHWMHEGANRAGSSAGVDLPLPPGAPTTLGVFTLADGRVTFTAAPGTPVTSSHRPVTTLALELDKTPLEAGTLRMLVIKRGTRIGLRVRDISSPARRAFKGLDYFPVTDRLRVHARFEPFSPPRSVPIVNVLGDVIDTPSPGRLVFRLDGVERSLDALVDDPESKDLFVIFRDATNGHTTYAAGRYLHVATPVNGSADVDFNEAYNPPCAFTPFATCPLPPKQNILPVAVPAGERVYHASPASSAIN